MMTYFRVETEIFRSDSVAGLTAPHHTDTKHFGEDLRRPKSM